MSGELIMSDYIFDTPIVYAGRSYMARPGSARYRWLERAAIHHNMRDYGNARACFRKAVQSPEREAWMIGGVR